MENEENIRNVYMMGLVSFFTDISSEMVFSVLPVFVLSLPGGSVAYLGLIEGTAEALSYILRAVSGVFSDKFRRRKPFILIGYAVSNVVKPFFSAAGSAAEVLFIRVADRVGKGIRTSPRDALISDSVSEKRRGEAFGLHRTLDQTGAILGPLIATGAMMFLGWGLKDVFLLSLVPGSLALVVILFGVKEIIGEAGSDYTFLGGLKEVMSGGFLRLLSVVTLFSLGAFNFSFILLNARDCGVADALIPVVYAVVNVAHTLVAIPAGKLSDRVGKEKVLAVGYVTFIASAGLLWLLGGSVAAAYLVALVFGAYMGIVETVQRALVPGYVDPGLKGTAYGVYYLVVGSCFFISNSAVGFLWQGYGVWASSIYSVAFASLAAVGLMGLRR